METQPPPQKGGRAPNFRPMSIVAVCIRIPLGTKIGLSLDDIVLDEDAAPLP